MKRLLLALAAANACHSMSALALDTPRGSKYDSRIQYVDYNDSDVVLVRASVGTGARIVFAPGEKIQDIGSGFMAGWQFDDLDNVLYVKARSIKLNDQNFASPEAGKWDTNLMVKTNLRMYDFDVVLLETDQLKSAVKQRSNGLAYRVQFQYPAEVLAELRAKAEKERAEAKLAAKPAPMNWNYSMQIGENSDRIAPAAAYDDGRFTYLRFPYNREFPAVFLVADDKTESIVNTHIDPSAPEYLVIHRVSTEMVLRLGDMVVGIYNEDYDPNGLPPNHGTTVPGVKRVLKAEESK